MIIFNAAQFKIFPQVSGIYKISFTNSNSGKCYIGSSITIRKRWITHLRALLCNKHVSKKLQYAYNKYGKDNLYLELIEECNKDECEQREQHYINLYNSYEYGYNSRPCASNQTGFKHSKETITSFQKMKKELFEKYKKENTVQVLQLYNDNFSIKQIKEILSLGKCVVTQILKDNNIKIKKRADYIKIPIYQYDKYGNFIQKWGSSYECAKDINIFESNIRRSLRTNGITNGFVFFYTEKQQIEVVNIIKAKKDEDSLKRHKNVFTEERKRYMGEVAKRTKNRLKYKSIHQYNLQGDLIKIWENISDIIHYFNLTNGSNIFKVLNKDHLSYKKCRWKCIDIKTKV